MVNAFGEQMKMVSDLNTGAAQNNMPAVFTLNKEAFIECCPMELSI